MRAALIAMLVALAPAVSVAAQADCRLITTVSATSIASGAITTSAFPSENAIASRGYPRWTYLKVSVDLVDANDGVSNLRLTFSESETYDGTYRVVPLCDRADSTLTCGEAQVDWDPSTHGKAYTIKPIDWGYLFGKITVTPTGNGAGDTAALTIYGCWE